MEVPWTTVGNLSATGVIAVLMLIYLPMGFRWLMKEHRRVLATFSSEQAELRKVFKEEVKEERMECEKNVNKLISSITDLGREIARVLHRIEKNGSL